MSVISSPADHREYKSLRLLNGLVVLLIHDPEIATNKNSNTDNNKPTTHGELVEDPLALNDGSDTGEDSDDDTDGSSGSEIEDGKGSSDDNEDLEHIRQRRPHASSTAGPTKKAASALSVGIGHFSDPDDLQGLSHYLEHMLFMGSDKYPDENDYDSFLSAHSGSSNACTEAEATTFHFDCAPGALHDALDRFAQFFVSPLVKTDAMDREVLAVDNEFSGVLQDDACRQLQLRSSTSRRGHPAAKFGWGNRKSLVECPLKEGIKVRERLLEHYNGHYSAERMNLVILGGEPMATLEAWAAEKFSRVPGGRGPRPRYDTFGAPFAGGELYVLPAVRDVHRLSASFQLPCLEQEYKKKAEDYVSHLIGHEGRGSLLSALKTRGWATDLCAGVTDQTSAAWIFEITMTLTDAGLAAGLGYGMAVVQILFEYLAMLRSAGVQRWAWDEMAAISQMKWGFLEEEDAADYAAQVASDMHMYPVHHALVGQYLHEDYDAELITSLLESFTPASVRLDLQTHDYDIWKSKLEDIAAPGTVRSGEEPWFIFPYASMALRAELLASWSAITSWPKDLALPPRNDYLPSDFNLRCETSGVDNKEVATSATPRHVATITNREPTAHGIGIDIASSPFPSPPNVAVDQPGLRVWHKMDVTFRVPRLTSLFRISCLAGYATPRAAAITHLVVKLLEDALCQEAYLADVAGLHYSVWFEGIQGIDVKVEGFSHKAHLISGLIFRTFAALHFTDDDFGRVHESLLRAYRNANVKPMKHATYLRLRLLKAALWEIEDIQRELETVTAADVRLFLPTLLADSHVEALVLGNAAAEEAAAIGETARNALGAHGIAAPTDRTLCLPNEGRSLLLRSRVKNPEEDNSAVEVYLQTGPTTAPRARAVLDLIDQLIYEPCYDTLRTKEQLGYVVSSGTRLTHGIAGLCVTIQSGTHGPAHLDARIEVFLASFAGRLKVMDDAEFDRNKEALIANKTMKDRNMAEEADRTWDLLINRGCDFHAREEEVEALRSLRRAEVESFFVDTFAPGGSARRKLGVHVIGRAHADEVNGPLPDGVEIVEAVEKLKEGLQFYPSVSLKAIDYT